jgi:hypothetical protein
LKYITVNIFEPCTKEANNPSQYEVILETGQLKLQSLAIIFDNLVSTKILTTMDDENKTKTQTLYSCLGAFFPVLHNTPQTQKEIEKEASGYFNKLYHGTLSLEQILTILRNLRSSS